MKLLLHCAILLLLSGCVREQVKKPVRPTKFVRTTTTSINVAKYQPFRNFPKDTLAYLEYNFIQRKNYYVERTLGALFKDLELPILSSVIWEGRRFKGGCDASMNDSIAGIYIALEKDGVVHRKLQRGFRPNELIVELEPFQADSAWSLNRKNYQLNVKWNEETENYYATKRIKNISVFKVKPR